VGVGVFILGLIQRRSLRRDAAQPKNLAFRQGPRAAEPVLSRLNR